LTDCVGRSTNKWLCVCVCTSADVRQQLSDQLRCLDQRVDCTVGMVLELQEYYQRHSEVEAELSRSLDKLDRQIRARHKAEKQRLDDPMFLTLVILRG